VPVTRIVADTNTVLSGLLWQGPPRRLLDRARERALGEASVDGHSVAFSHYFPMQKLEKIRPSRSSLVNSPVISFSAC
jgi:predicted nucleic acid-binding protein